MHRRGKSSLMRIVLTSVLVDALANLMPVGGGSAPSVVMGSRWRNGQWRKIIAEYPNGWNVRINFTRTGEISSTSADIRLESRICGKNGSIVVDEMPA